MIKRLFPALLLVLLAPAAARPAPGTELLNALRQEASRTRTIACDFVQETHMALFDEVVSSEGKFFFKRPDMVRWEYTNPFSSGFVMQGEKGREWDEATGQVRNFTASGSPQMAVVTKQIVAWTTFDIQWLETQYDIQAEAHPAPHLRLTPRGKTVRSFIQHLDFYFSKDRSVLKRIELHSPDGDFTRIRFSNHRINGDLTDTTFTVAQ